MWAWTATALYRSQSAHLCLGCMAVSAFGLSAFCCDFLQVGVRQRWTTMWVFDSDGSFRRWTASSHLGCVRLKHACPYLACGCSAGRSETEVEYNVGFDSDGLIQALDCKVWCLGGAYLDISSSDIAGVMTGLNQVRQRLLLSLTDE